MGGMLIRMKDKTGEWRVNGCVLEMWMADLMWWSTSLGYPDTRVPVAMTYCAIPSCPVPRYIEQMHYAL